MLKNKCVLCLAFIFCALILSACIDRTQPAVTETWTRAEASTYAWFSEDKPDDFMGVNTDPETIRVGKTIDGKNIFSLIYLPMRGTWLGGEIEDARLYLKLADGKSPSALRISLVNGFWSNAVTGLADAIKLFKPEASAAVTVKEEDDGWYSMDVTSYVKDWLSGDVQNNGLALLGDTDGEQASFVSDWVSKDPPRLEVRGAVAKRDLSYGKFAYLRHPENVSDDGELVENETANCLSYALRDTNIIGAEELGIDYGAMTEIYRRSGEDAVADYCVQKITEYVESHKVGLKISSFRRIENFDSEIDAAKEYRIAFRVGCKLYGDDEVFTDEPGNFDYHVWAQINTGQWAQKFMFTPTVIIPGTPPGVSPGKYPWDATLDWGDDKFHAFYTSKVVYFAVVKDTEGFTQHKTA